MPLQDFNQLMGTLPAPAINSPLVYLTAAFQVHPLFLGRCSVLEYVIKHCHIADLQCQAYLQNMQQQRGRHLHSGMSVP